MAAPWRRSFPDVDSFETAERVERELTSADLERAGSALPEGVTEVDLPDGTTGLRVVPPKFGPAGAYLGGAVGLGLAALGVVTLGWGVQSTGGRITGVATLVLGLLAAAFLLDHEIRWELDRTGFRTVTGLRRRQVPWEDVRRMRLVVMRQALGRGGYRWLRRLYVLDGAGRSLGWLPYVTITLDRARAEADVRALVAIAAACRRRGWLTRLGDHALDAEGITPLMDAAAGRRPDLGTLLAAGPDLEARDGEGMTALHYAAAWGTEETVTALLGAGADLEARTPYGFTPYLTAVHHSRPTADVLAAAGARTDVDDVEVRFTARHWRPLLATLLPGLVVAVGFPVVVDLRPVWSDWVTAIGAGLLLGLLLLRMLRPLLFWSGGVPRSRAARVLTLRRGWGRRLRLDLDRVTAADWVPPTGHRASWPGGAGLVLVTDGGPGWRLKPRRVRALGLGHHAEALRGRGDRGVYVVVDPGAASDVLVAVLPRLIRRQALVSTEVYRAAERAARRAV